MGRQEARIRKTKKRSGGWIFISLIFLITVVLVTASFLFFEDIFVPSRILTEEEYFKSTEERVALLYNHELQAANAVIRDGALYVPAIWYSKVVDDKFYYSEDERQVILTRADEVLRFGFDDKDASGRSFFVTFENTIYILLDLGKIYSNIRVEDYTDLEIKRVNISNLWGEYHTSKVKGGARIFSSMDRSSDTIYKFKRGEEVRLLESLTPEEFAAKERKWVRVTTGAGFTGYIQKKKLGTLQSMTEQSNFTAPEYTVMHLNEKVILGWHQVTNKDTNAYVEDVMKNTQGMNVISPTWFSLSDNEGNYTSLAAAEYVAKAHEKGMQVWVLVDNFNKEVKSEVLLAQYANRQKLISGFIKEAKEIGFDGINIDFETLKQDAIVHYIQFLRELSVACRREKLVLSVDVPNYAAFNAYYDREAIAEVADYVINMGYDEHYVGSKKGSVASIEFVRSGIERTLQEVPADKLIGAVPFYARVWTENGTKLSSKAIGMDEQQRWIEENDIKLVWDEALGQYFGSLETGEGIRSIWMEEEKSLGLKIQFMKEKQLAGVAGWKLGLDSKAAWTVLQGIKE